MLMILQFHFEAWTISGFVVIEGDAPIYVKNIILTMFVFDESFSLYGYIRTYADASDKVNQIYDMILLSYFFLWHVGRTYLESGTL